MTGLRPRPVAFGLVVAVCSACGSRSSDDIPPGLLEAIAKGAVDGTGEYPEGPYGGELGDVAPNVCVEGWRDPSAEAYDADAMETVCFADFWHPEATSASLLLVNTSAIWCLACQAEYGGSGSRPSLSAEASARADRGLELLGVLFQDSQFEPADSSDGVTWAKSFSVDFPFGVDAPFAMGAFADPQLQPFNMVLDTTDMRIVLRVEGDEPDTLWPAIDSLLQ